MSELGFTAETVEGIDLGHEIATGHHEIGHIAPVRWKVRGCAAHSQELAETRLGVVKSFAESPNAKPERR